MLEEKGCLWCLYHDADNGEEEPVYCEVVHKEDDFRKLRVGRCTTYEIRTDGPDPATALLRAWLEVVKEEE